MPVVVDINSAHENVIVVSINSASKSGATAQDKVLAGKVANAIVGAANSGKVPSIAKRNQAENNAPSDKQNNNNVQ